MHTTFNGSKISGRDAFDSEPPSAISDQLHPRLHPADGPTGPSGVETAPQGPAPSRKGWDGGGDTAATPQRSA